MGVFEDLANQKPGMHWQHDRHHTMLANPYDPSRDLSPNLPTTSCRGQELTNVFAVAGGGHGQCCAFKSEFDDDYPDCCKVSPPGPMGVGDDYRGGPLALPCKQERDPVLADAGLAVGMGSSPVHQHHHHHLHHDHHDLRHHDLHHGADRPPSHHHHLGPTGGYASPEPSSSLSPPPPGVMSSYPPYGSPTPPANMLIRPKQEEPEVNLCDGCGLKILDRYYLFAVDKRWHATCLQCSQCARTLATEIKCFYRDGNIYCKTDYQRLFGIRRCGRCQAAILPSELVMRARDTVFHVPCFSCTVCTAVLTKGDQFGMRDGAVFCQHHYQQYSSASLQQAVQQQQQHQHHHLGLQQLQQHQLQQQQQQQQQSELCRTLPPSMTPTLAAQSPYPSSRALESPAPGVPGTFFNGPAGGGGGGGGGGNGPSVPAPAQPRQKGRPRKRKPKDLDAMAANMDMNSSDSYNMEMAFGPGGLSSGAGGNGGPGSGHQRTKRMRTSFKHHQLRTMKSYFHHNHNPDAKDLKQLSQKTGLPKRVLQVWFQNARAKYRRTATKQDGGLGSLAPPSSVKPDKSCSESSTGSAGIEAVMFHQQQQQQHHAMQMSPRSYLSTSSPMECGS
ncbi:Homeobox domain,Homeobox, conserved site,Homeobox domain-like,Zinc finger, LIM-type [Cinara cedri]|uniref:Homeobox domain,Homeobox, conserved site,Homeobox domain-like,Zinc finger, LIM-type n=1 Tax=Cinara cedri TaxID=506608 RepID=A0A5E4N678_9HEMI|nr:Homeobox domain,Homeobox, conserved site,Homeobox domain-like,Zinc finger, LIM-type [Cinara cedri]